MSEFWRLGNGYYAFYTRDRDIMKKIKRSYAERIRLYGKYIVNGQTIAKQYRFTQAELQRVRRFIANEKKESLIENT